MTKGARRDEPLILAFDTSMAHCAGAIFHDAPRGQMTEEMSRGQAERLMPMLETLLASEGVSWQDLDLIAVGIGPGNFTGIRIAVSAARGLGLGLGIPVMGVSMFECLLDPTGPWAGPSQIVSLAAPRGQVYLQHFRYGVATEKPRQLDLAALPEDLQFPVNTHVIGYAAEAIAAAGHASDWTEAAPENVAMRIARRADARFFGGETDPSRPAPLYVRAADAAPSRDKPPEIIA